MDFVVWTIDNAVMKIGVLAFQGDFMEHLDVLHSLNVNAIEVRSIADLDQVDGLIIPGGESTVIAKFLEETGVGKKIIERIQRGAASPHPRPLPRRGRGAITSKPLFIYGTCAGAIVLAKEATGKNAPQTLNLIDITIDRNAYGSQVDSFETMIRVNPPVRRAAKFCGSKSCGSTKNAAHQKIPVAFIRAPKITQVGKGVDILATHQGLPVLVRQGNVLVGTFHPEVRWETRIHEMFLQLSETMITRD